MQYKLEEVHLKDFLPNDKDLDQDVSKIQSSQWMVMVSLNTSFYHANTCVDQTIENEYQTVLRVSWGLVSGLTSKFKGVRKKIIKKKCLSSQKNHFTTNYAYQVMFEKNSKKSGNYIYVVQIRISYPEFRKFKTKLFFKLIISLDCFYLKVLTIYGRGKNFTHPISKPLQWLAWLTVGLQIQD